MTNITKNESRTLYMAIKFIHDAFTKHNIKYWLTFGTLLGGIRHGGIIPWDDDGDICVMQQDVPKIRKLIPFFAKNKFILEKVDGENISDDIYKKVCRNKKDSCDWFVSYNSPFSLGVDIFVTKFKPKNRKKIIFSNPYWADSSQGKNCQYLKKYVFPLVPLRFGNFFCYVPNNTIQYLNTCYGKEWNSISAMGFNHSGGFNKARNIKNFKPITPPKSTCDNKIPPIIPYNKRSKGCNI